MQRPLVNWIYRRARRFRLYREAISSLYTFGYGLFRIYFLALGDRLVQRGIINACEDVFYLDLEAIGSIADDSAQADWKTRIAQTKHEIASCSSIIPPSTVYGNQVLPVDVSPSDALKGTPTSRGRYTGRVKVIRSLLNFGGLREGDVLTVPYSDVGWTPLFTKAGAVIAESGGLLSHSSIVAREYGIPAVVSVPGACQLQDDTLVTVDGYRGEIVIHERPSNEVQMSASLELEGNHGCLS